LQNPSTKSFNEEQAEKSLATGAYRTSRMAGFLQHPGRKQGGKQFPISRHTLASIGKVRKIGASFVLSPATFGCGEQWLDFRTMPHDCQTPIFLNSEKLRKALIQLTEKLINQPIPFYLARSKAPSL
jgi:hypothetical protein